MPKTQFSTSWAKTQAELDSKSFEDLLNNRCASIVLDEFFSLEECTLLVKALRQTGLKNYAYEFNTQEAPMAAHLFETHYLYETKTASEYFKAARESFQLYEQVVQTCGIDPVQRVTTQLQQCLSKHIQIAEQDEERYFPAIARELNDSVLLHADFAQFIPAHWIISRITAEISWNIYLTDPEEGGECVVYDKLWEREDDSHIRGNSYGYDHAVVGGRPFAQIAARPGRLVFFNSRNFHEVHAAKSPRVSVGGHIGLTPENTLILWS
jgi:hypothetical protein